MECWREDHRHPVMDIADGRTGRAGEDYEAKLSIALLSRQSGQVQHQLRGADRVLDFIVPDSSHSKYQMAGASIVRIALGRKTWDCWLTSLSVHFTISGSLFAG